MVCSSVNRLRALHMCIFGPTLGLEELLARWTALCGAALQPLCRPLVPSGGPFWGPPEGTGVAGPLSFPVAGTPGPILRPVSWRPGQASAPCPCGPPPCSRLLCPAWHGRLVLQANSKPLERIRRLPSPLLAPDCPPRSPHSLSLTCFLDHLSLGGHVWQKLQALRGFAGSLAGKESACNAGDPSLIPESGRSPGDGIGCPLQCSGLENAVLRCRPWGRKESDVTGRLSLALPSRL